MNPWQVPGVQINCNKTFAAEPSYSQLRRGVSHADQTMKAIFSFYTDALKIALQSIFAHKLRAFLTLIGIIIGVASVVTVGASISGLNTYVVDKLAKVLGSNHFMIARIASSGRLSDDEFEKMNRRNKRLNWDDFEWVRDHCKSCAEIGAEVGGQTDLKQDGVEFPGAIVFGVTANMVDVEDKTIALMRQVLRGVDRQALVSQGFAPAMTPCPPNQPVPVAAPLITVPA